MTKTKSAVISAKKSLLSAFIMHGSLEIPFFIFPVILLLIGNDLFPESELLSRVGIGSLGAISTLAAGLPSPLFGRLTDKYRRGVMMVCSLLLEIFGSLIIGLFGSGFFPVMFGLVLMGIGIALYHPAGLSWIASAFEEETHQSHIHVRIFAIHGVGGTFGAAIGPLSVYILINVIHWREIYLFWVLPLIMVVLGFWVLIGKNEKSNQVDHTTDELKVEISTSSRKLSFTPFFVLIFSFIALLSVTRGMVNYILSPFLSEIKSIDIATAALFVAVSTFIGITGEITGGILGDKWGESSVLSVYAFSQIIILILIYFSEFRLLIFILYIFLGINNGFFWPSTNSLVAKNAASTRGSAFGLVLLFAHIFAALGPFLDGILLVIDLNKYSLIFLFACLFSLVGALLMLLIKFFLKPDS